MKKLNLKGGYKEMLSQTRMKQIMGGGTCNAGCTSGKHVYCEGSECDAIEHTSEHDGICSWSDGTTIYNRPCGASYGYEQ